MRFGEWGERLAARCREFERNGTRDLLVTLAVSILLFLVLELSGLCGALLETTRAAPGVFHAIVFAACGGFGLLLLAWLHRRRAGERARLEVLDRSEVSRMRESIDRAEAGCRASLAGFGHDLRTPLNAVTGYCEILADDALALGLPDTYRDYALQAAKAGHELGHMIQDLLGVLQEFQTMAARDSRPVALCETLERVAAGMAPVARAKGVTLAVPRFGCDDACCISSHPLLMATMLEGLMRFLVRLAAPESIVAMNLEPGDRERPLVLRVRLRPGRSAGDLVGKWCRIRDLSPEDDGWTSRPADPALHTLRGGLPLCGATLEGPTTTAHGDLEFRLFLPRRKEDAGKKRAADLSATAVMAPDRLRVVRQH